MKILKYLTVLASVIFFASCEKHDLTIANEELLADNMAELRLHYAEPLTTGATYRFDSLYINGKLNANSTNAFGPTNVMPNSNTFYSVPAGTVNIKCWRKGNLVYDYDITAKAGKQDVFMYDIEQAPIVYDSKFPYYSNAATGTAATWGSDSTAYIEFFNFLYEEYGTKKVPYSGTLQLQYQDTRTEEWVNIGSPVKFGEASGRAKVKVVKPAGIDYVQRTITYRLVDAEGNPFKYTNTSGKEVEYTLNYNTRSGRVYLFYTWGIRTSKSITAQIVAKAIH